MLKRFFYAYLGAFLLTFIPAYAHADDPEYAAAFVIQRADGTSPPGKIYVARSFIRTQVEGQDSYTIVNLILSKAYVVVPAQEAVMEVDVPTNLLPRVGRALDGETQRTSVGQDKVSGYDTEKFIVSHQTGAHTSETLTQWLRPDNVTVKLATGDESWAMILSNIAVGKQSNDLFDIPSDYKRLDAYGRPAVEQ